ncbi:helix-turn-helix transcriptional regulator [Cytophaga aurantiaca]|uniref:helix-turn-helix transcriptional regulator n=1 Tax=Cytophaga aurantiaca TaxID=29530 RepID=UPI000360359F|nr:AraC family transcriptional regulator [Cytophaga aurantiaca]
MKNFGLRVALLCLPILFFLVAFFLYKPHKVYTVLPVKDSLAYNLYTYSDTIKPSLDYSTASIVSANKDSITFTYKLDTGNTAPFAGITLLSKAREFLFIDTYDIFEIELYTSLAKRPQILLGVASSDTIANKGATEKYITKDLDLIQGEHTYQIPLKEFTTPSWWYVNEGISEKDLANVDFTRLHMINIQNCQLIARNTEDKITIKQVRFIKDVKWFYILSVILIAAYYALCYFFIVVQASPKQTTEKIEIRYTPIEMVNHSELDLDKLVSYLSSHYDNSELSLKIIQEGTGLSETKVSQLLKNAYQLSFKQYLNQLRLNEAKRLLKDVNVPVSDIAYRVGYGHISHFNRVFKEHEGMSPNDYRKKE